MTALRCTYRLQLGPGLGFADARALVPYLRDLGVSHLYLSPSFQAREGSTHGYDVVDPTRISAELGGEEEFRALAAAAREAGLGIVLDIVPNHMATDQANRWWSDESLRPKFFDVDPETGAHRRFFDIDHLAGVRQEDPEVFEATHRLALDLVGEGLVDGLRIDHPDGMADPAGYLRRLRSHGVERVWVEKILIRSHPPEQLRDWPVSGTVGYEFLVDVAALFVDPAGEGPLTDLLAELTGETRPFGEIAFEAKLEQASTTFRPEVERLDRICAVPGVERLLSSLPVYRTYDGGASAEDRAVLEEAGLPGLYDGRPAEWVTRFQQTTPPVMAKGVEDTAFYRYVRLLALNDVGGDPGRFGITVERFHEANLERRRRFPENLLITQTHDTKRSGDVRARIGALAGMAPEWGEHVRRWFALNAPLREGSGAPDATEEYFLYQTLVGAWPISAGRLDAYLEKALREAKRNTTWVEQDHAWEQAVQGFARRVVEHEPFLADFLPFAERVAEAGHRAAMGQLLLKLTVPGVPDIYQGDELVDLSLVDPDNRRPVDWDLRRTLLTNIKGSDPLNSLGSSRGLTPGGVGGGLGPVEARGAEKLALVVRALRLRRERENAFSGAYEPLDAGPDVCAFVRGGDVLAVAVMRDAGLDAEVRLPGRWRDVLGDGATYDTGAGAPVRALTGGRSYGLLAAV